MNLETIIAELEQANRWRRGSETELMPEPTRLGEVIDAAVASLRSLVASNTTLRRERNEARAKVARVKLLRSVPGRPLPQVVRSVAVDQPEERDGRG